MEITSNKISEKHHSSSLVLNSNRLNKYKTTSSTGIKTEEQYLRLENELVELDYYQFKIISADDITAYLLPKKREIHTAESLRKQHQRFRDLLMFQNIAYQSFYWLMGGQKPLLMVLWKVNEKENDRNEDKSLS